MLTTGTADATSSSTGDLVTSTTFESTGVDSDKPSHLQHNDIHNDSITASDRSSTGPNGDKDGLSHNNSSTGYTTRSGRNIKAPARLVTEI